MAKKVKLEDMVFAAKEFNKLFGLSGSEEAIKVKGVDEAYLTGKLTEAIDLLTEEDELSERTQSVLIDLDLISLEPEAGEIHEPDPDFDDVREDDEFEDPPIVEKEFINSPKAEKVKANAKNKIPVTAEVPKPEKAAKPEKAPKEKKKIEKSTNPFNNNAYVVALALKDGKPITKKEWAAKVKELREANGCEHSAVTTKFWIRYIPDILKVFGVKANVPMA